MESIARVISRNAMVWYDMIWYGMVWYGMVWYGMVWYSQGSGSISPRSFWFFSILHLDCVLRRLY